MIWKIARKEFLSNLLTIRFAVGTVLLVFLTILFTSILISDYQQNLEEQDKLAAKNEEELNQLKVYQNLRPLIYKPPEVLTIFSKGIEENIAKSAQISVEEVPVLTSAGTSKNPLLSVFSVLDVVLVFKLVISVLAFLLVYDAISGEKEDGTLRLVLSYKVPRYQLIFGKFLGGMLTLAIPIALGFLITVLIMELSPMISLTGGEWLRIILMFVASLIMVSVMFNIGLFVSSLTKRASDTLIVLLFIWVVFLLIIPNASSYLAPRAKPIESRDKITAQIQGIRGRMIFKALEIRRQNPEEEGKIYIQSDAVGPTGGYMWFATKCEILRRQKLNQLTLPLRMDYAREVGDVNRKYIESLVGQKNWVDSMSRVSPISVYERLMSALSRTDLSSLENFTQQARSYRQQLVDYLHAKDAFSSIRYFSTIKKEHLIDVSSHVEYGKYYLKYGNRNPEPLDLSDLPRFQYRQEKISVALKRILPDFFLLSFMGVFFFVCAFVAILRYDVR